MKRRKPPIMNDPIETVREKEELLRGALAGERGTLMEVAARCAEALIKRARKGDRKAAQLLDEKFPGWREADSEQRSSG